MRIICFFTEVSCRFNPYNANGNVLDLFEGDLFELKNNTNQNTTRLYGQRLGDRQALYGFYVCKNAKLVVIDNRVETGKEDHHNRTLCQEGSSVPLECPLEFEFATNERMVYSLQVG